MSSKLLLKNMKSDGLRKIARGQECQIRLPCCNANHETTVLAHYRLAGHCGTGVKPDDFVFGAWACSACHDVVDGRAKIDGWSKSEIRLAHAEGVMRTQMLILEEL